jgi:hypothetical protein
MFLSWYLLEKSRFLGGFVKDTSIVPWIAGKKEKLLSLVLGSASMGISYMVINLRYESIASLTISSLPSG